MVYFFGRGQDRRTCEVRLDESGIGYELLATEGGRTNVEHFDTIQKLLAREHELTTAWRAMGWKDTMPPRLEFPESDCSDPVFPERERRGDPRR